MDESNEPIVGESPATVAMRARVAQVARYRYNVMITGPPGVGKRFLAEHVHRASPRSEAPFIPIDCSQLTEQVFAAQMFGHAADEFAGTSAPSLGVLRSASGGTLFLGRVEALPASLQGTLFEVLSAKEVVPVGGRKAEVVEFRIISSTRTNLQKEVQDRRLLPELYTLLDEVSLHLDPLTTRREDVLPLADFYMRRACEEFGLQRQTLHPAAIKMLQSYHWPGNAAELLEVIERAVLADEESTTVLAEHLEF